MTNGQKLDLLINEVADMKTKMLNMETKMSNMETKISDMETRILNRFETIEDSVKSINLILENEINVNICRVAEGHLDLSRNLHKAMKPSNELEMHSIRISALEKDVREIKKKIS